MIALNTLKFGDKNGHPNPEHSKLHLVNSDKNHQRQNPRSEPKWWKKNCSNSACPTYSKFISLSSIFIIFGLVWAVLMTIAPKLIAPEGQFCNMIGLLIPGYITGKLLNKLTSLPPMIGMFFMGILLQNIGYTNLEGDFSIVVVELRRIAIVIALTRAGLNFDMKAVKSVFCEILKLGLLPWLFETIAIAVLIHFTYQLPWIWACLLSSIVGTVSTAVIVPCFGKLKKDGYIIDEGIPKLILTAAIIDDTLGIGIYSIVCSILFTKSYFAPLFLFAGIIFGFLWGYLLKYLPEKSKSHMSFLRILLLFLGCYSAMCVGNLFGFTGIGPLTTISASFTANYNWSRENRKISTNPVATAFQVAWAFFEPIFFCLSGSLIKISEIELYIVGLGAACLSLGLLIRIITTYFIWIGDDLNMREKLFASFSWVAKATVQAALGPVALDFFKKNNGSEDELRYSKIVFTISMLSIILAAPLSASLISLVGPKLLYKTKPLNYPIETNSKENKDDEENSERGFNL